MSEVERSIPTQQLSLQRREFLKTTTGVITGVLAAGSPLALLAPTTTWAVDFTTLNTAEGTALMAMARTIAPHDKLEDAAYALVVQSLDADVGKDADLLKAVREGLQALGAAFASAPESERVEALRKVESSAFFQQMRFKTLSVLYATPMAYAYFGYEGEAFSKGGYLTRGFNDLRWLPDVPLTDSGPAGEA